MTDDQIHELLHLADALTVEMEGTSEGDNPHSVRAKFDTLRETVDRYLPPEFSQAAGLDEALTRARKVLADELRDVTDAQTVNALHHLVAMLDAGKIR